MTLYNAIDKQMKMEIHNHVIKKDQGPVTCLGIDFANDSERRKYFTEILRDKLKDPEFRKIEGFPLGEDENILAISDPPYYTACPNPWLESFITLWGKSNSEQGSEKYFREPFAADVSEGKNHPIYNAHSYHTKVPHKAVMRYILHYTDPGDIVFDGFSGTGMTAVAAQLCGNSNEIKSLGYQVTNDGIILDEILNEESKRVWKPISRTGLRRTILNDLSPAATFISNIYNTPVDVGLFKSESNQILQMITNEFGWMYETLHVNGQLGKINYTVWSDVFICPDCLSEITYWEVSVNKNTWQVEDTFKCNHCGTLLGKREMERSWVSLKDAKTGELKKIAKQIPVLIHYKLSNKSYTKKPDIKDLQILETISKQEIPYWYPSDALPIGDKMSDPKSVGIKYAYDFYSKRSLILLARYADLTKKASLDSRLLANLTSSAIVLSKQYRFRSQDGNLGAGGGPMNGTLYVPSLYKEIPVMKVIEQHIERLEKVIIMLNKGENAIQTGSFSSMRNLPDQCVDYIFIDPPFGSNLMYSELNFLWESWLKVKTNNQKEAIENRSQKKFSNEYRSLMTECFYEAYRILKPGRWITVEFSNTKAAVWNSIQTALSDAGFIVANISALDKKQGSFNSVTNTTSVKQDLVISAYKPSAGFEDRYNNEAHSEDGVWDFVRTHLRYLPVNKIRNGSSQFIPERDPRILFDQMVAYYVRKGNLVPISSQEFQNGLYQRFVERDGMFFLAEQAAEFDRMKIQTGHLLQMDLIMSDEATAIDWLRYLLREKPQTFAEINPQFMTKLGGWSKYEDNLDLRELLSQNFISYDGKGPVPEQIHTYLSTNWREYRNLSKEDHSLISKAKDRWYVPDPNKAGDLEKLRERSLLKEFDIYIAAPKKLKQFRIEAVRAGFKKAWQERDYMTIVSIAEKIPSNVLEEDPKLLMWYDQAMTRLGR